MIIKIFTNDNNNSNSIELSSMFSSFNRGETNLLKFFPLFWETGTKVLPFPF